MVGMLPRQALTRCETDPKIKRIKTWLNHYNVMRTDLATHGDRSTLCCLVLLRVTAGKHTRLPPHLHRAGLPTAAAPYPVGPTST